MHGTPPLLPGRDQLSAYGTSHGSDFWGYEPRLPNQGELPGTRWAAIRWHSLGARRMADDDGPQRYSCAHHIHADLKSLA